MEQYSKLVRGFAPLPEEFDRKESGSKYDSLFDDLLLLKPDGPALRIPHLNEKIYTCHAAAIKKTGKVSKRAAAVAKKLEERGWKLHVKAQFHKEDNTRTMWIWVTVAGRGEY